MKHTLCMIALTVASAAFGAQATAGGVMRVVPLGIDGDVRHYSVYCKNRTVFSITVENAKGRVCVRRLGGRRTCRMNWTLREAALYGCR